MAQNRQEFRVLALMVLLAAWLAAYGYSIVHLLGSGATPAAPVPGLGPLSGFAGWQGVAGMIAFACWGIGHSLPAGSGVRRVSGVPLALALVLVLVGIGMAVLGA